jgi:TetR/AcrR family transcriptional repressor of nem operon
LVSKLYETTRLIITTNLDFGEWATILCTVLCFQYIRRQEIMGRPSKFNRLEALATLKDSIWSNGFELSSVKSLSEKLGITRSSFYNSFKSREDLFEELLDDYSQAINGKEIFPRNDNDNVLLALTNKMKLICLRMVCDNEKRGCLAVSNIQDVVSKNERLDTYINNFFSSNVKYCLEVLDTAVSRGELWEATKETLKGLALYEEH